MFQLKNKINGIVYNRIFKTNAVKNIVDWVRDNIDFFSDELNECYSCSVNLCHNDETIIISGDEDLMYLDIIDAVVVKFKN